MGEEKFPVDGFEEQNSIAQVKNDNKNVKENAAEAVSKKPCEGVGEETADIVVVKNVVKFEEDFKETIETVFKGKDF